MSNIDPEHLRNAALQHWRTALDSRAFVLPQSNAFTEGDVNAVIDAELEALQALPALLQIHRERRLASVQENRNARLATTRSLPSEVLGCIFQFHANDTMHWLTYVPRDYFRWTSVAHVSQRWRRTALSTSNLWTKLHLLMSEDAWLTYVDRSRGRLLTIEGEWRRASPQRRESIIHRFQRIAELHISVQRGIHNNPFQDLGPVLMHFAPNLHTLDLIGDFDTWHPVLNDFILARTPVLRTLSLKDIYFPWGADIAELEHLVLTTAADHKAPESRNPLAAHTFEQVLHTLQGAHNLRTLDLGGNHVLIAPLHQPEPPIHIAARKLTLLYDGNPVTIRSPVDHLLSALNAEPDRHIDIFYHGQTYTQRRHERSGYDSEDENNEMSFTARVSQALHSHLLNGEDTGPPPFSVFQLLADHPSGYITFKLGHEITPLSSFHPWGCDPEDPPAVYVRSTVSKSVICDTPDSLRAKTLKLAWSVPDDHFAHLQHLMLTGLCWQKDDTISVFSQAPRVKSLTIYDSQPDGLPRHTTALLLSDIMRAPALGLAPAANEPPVVPPDMLFPLLRRLHIIGVRFTYSVQCDGGALPLDEAMPLFLDRRRLLGCGLQYLHVENCQFRDRAFAGPSVRLIVESKHKGFIC